MAQEINITLYVSTELHADEIIAAKTRVEIERKIRKALLSINLNDGGMIEVQDCEVTDAK